jgi:hypothetical protein
LVPQSPRFFGGLRIIAGTGIGLSRWIAVTSGNTKAMKNDKDSDARSRQAIRAQIDENLKRVYGDALNEELPDRFRDLLAQLKDAQGDGKGGAG